MKLIDTSAWIHSLRADGDADVRNRVRALLESGDAAWCPLVRLELWNGARGEHERRVLREMEQFVVDLEISAAVWCAAQALAQKARSTGKTVPTTDILIAACAGVHGVAIEHADEHLAVLASVSL